MNQSFVIFHIFLFLSNDKIMLKCKKDPQDVSSLVFFFFFFNSPCVTNNSNDDDDNNNATILRSSDKEIRVSDRELQKVKNIINKANTDRYMKDVQNQIWVGKFVTQH